ncbi:hypothetical protein [Lysobacter gummosus]
MIPRSLHRRSGSRSSGLNRRHRCAARPGKPSSPATDNCQQ